MHPFFPPLPNHPQPQGANHPPLQQAMLPNGPNHQQFINPLMMPNFNNFNAAHLPNLHSNNPGILSQPPHLMPLQLAQNGVNPALAIILQAQLAQQNLLGLLQSPHLAAALQQGGQNPMAGLPNRQFGLPNALMNANQMMPASLGVPPFPNPLAAGMLNSGFVGNLQTGANNVNPNGSNMMPESQKSQPHNPHRRSQGYSVEESGKNIMNANSEISTTRNATRNFQGRERPQNSQHHLGKNVKGSFVACNRNGRRAGQHNWREGKPQFMKSSEKAVVESKRHPPVIYTEKEIQQWREERRKNFPTRGNVGKKLSGNSANHEVTDADAKLRRQQMKEILAKQAELGVEIAEVPPGYLSDGENQICERKNEEKKWNNQRKERDPTGRYPNKYNKRGRQGCDKWEAKRHKLGNDAPTRPVPKSEPSLLQKLLSADIKRDKSKLLQVFRFMVLNSFFDHWPDKPLEFPELTVKRTESDGDVTKEDVPSLAGVDAAPHGGGKDTMGDGEEHPRDPSDTQEPIVVSVASDPESDCEVENRTGGNEMQAGDESEKSEEGEITE